MFRHVPCIASLNCACSPGRILPTSQPTRLANAAYHLLLTSGSTQDDAPPNPLSGLLASENPYAVLLLPQIENILRSYLPHYTRRTVAKKTSRGEQPPSIISTAASVEETSVTSSKLTLSLHGCLCRLHDLVSCCPHVRRAVIGSGEKSEKCNDNLPEDQKPAGSCSV